MYADVNERITGFEFNFDNSEQIERRDEFPLQIDYFENGKKIFSEYLGTVTNVELRRIQERLLESVMVNQDIYDSWEEAKKFTNRNRILGVANMFRMDVINGNSDKTCDIKIAFIKSGYRITTSTITNISKEKLEEIKELLVDNMKFNLTCTQQCNAVTYLDILAVIERK